MLRKICHILLFGLDNFFLAVRSMFWKRQDNIILFGAWFGEKFADNPRFLFQYLSKNKEKYNLSHVIWVTRNKDLCNLLNRLGYESYTMNSPQSIYFHKKAGIHILCNGTVDSNEHFADLIVRLSYGAKRLNLWHGVGVIKNLGYSRLEYQTRKKLHPNMYAFKECIENTYLYRTFFSRKGGWGNSYWLDTTIASTRQVMRFGGVSPKKIIYSQYPRLCPCPELLPQEMDVILIMKKFQRTIIYLPTFRTYASSKFASPNIALLLSDFFREKNILWIQKAHSASQISLPEGLSNNILTLPVNFDINVILPNITLLITDYSSVVCDARFFEIPILFFVPDIEMYRQGDNGFTEEADELMDGPKYFTIEQLKEGINTYIDYPDAAKSSRYMQLRKKYIGEEKTLAQIWQDINEAFQNK